MADGERVALYRYGPIAWVWRVLILAVVLGCAAALVAAPTSWQVWLAAAPLLLPSLFFGHVVAARIDAIGASLHVVTLLGLPRRIARDRLGPPRLRQRAYTNGHAVHAPRWWVPVRGGLPLHVDLLGTIVDARAMERVFGARPRR
jgi:hypothetical protein